MTRWRYNLIIHRRIDDVKRSIVRTQDDSDWLKVGVTSFLHWIRLDDCPLSIYQLELHRTQVTIDVNSWRENELWWHGSWYFDTV